MASMDLDSFMAAAAEHFEAVRPFVPMYIHLILSALFPIYAGAHASLSRPSSAAKPEKKSKRKVGLDDEDDDEDTVQKMEGLSPKDAILFPITAGLVLAGLYFLIKRYGADLINLVMGWYFAFVGVYSVARLVNDAATVAIGFVFPTYFAHRGILYHVDGEERAAKPQGQNASTSASLRSPVPLLPAFSKSFYDGVWAVRATVKRRYSFRAFVHGFVDLKAKVTIINFLSAAIGLASILYANLVAKPWYLTNLQGFAVCYSAMQFLSPTTFGTGSLILSGLFFYDIWAVFFTPLMVTVAKNLDQPIKLVFPRPHEAPTAPGQAPPPRSYSMLGLGDIVLPGIMIGLALRFDLYMFYLKKQKVARSGGNGPKNAASMEKAPFVPATGFWGDRFWTLFLRSDLVPDTLKTSFPKTYFWSLVVGYTIGMLTTLGVMSVFQHAQPALLYLVPGVLLSLWGTALVRGEVKQLWEFTEALNAEQIEESDNKKGSKTAENEDKKSDDRTFWQKLKDELFGAGEEKPKEDERTDPDADADGKSAARKSTGPDDGVLFAFVLSRYDPSKPSASDKLAREPEVNTQASAPTAQSQTSSESDLEIVCRNEA